MLNIAWYLAVLVICRSWLTLISLLIVGVAMVVVFVIVSWISHHQDSRFNNRLGPNILLVFPRWRYEDGCISALNDCFLKSHAWYLQLILHVWLKIWFLVAFP